MLEHRIPATGRRIGEPLGQRLVTLARGRHRILREIIQRDPAARGELLPCLQRLRAPVRHPLQAGQHAQSLRIVRLEPNRSLQTHLRLGHFVLLQIFGRHLRKVTALASFEFSVSPVAGVSRTAENGEDEEKKKETAKKGTARWVEMGHFGSF